MNSTKDNIFIDTNVLIYLYSKDEPTKQVIASEFLLRSQAKFVISTQVVGEFINILTRKYSYEIKTIKVAIADFKKNFKIALIDIPSIEHALYIMNRYNFSYWDSLIILSALKEKCPILYSEDLQNNQIIAKKLKILNPFK